MATFFGEILPVVSRAVDEDEDDEEPEQLHCSSVLRWSALARSDIDSCLKGIAPQSTLIISLGPTAAGFTQAYIIGNRETDLLGVICSGMKDKQVNSLSQQTFTDSTCYIYRFKGQKNIILVQCKSEVPPEQYYSWTELLLADVWKLLPKEDLDHSYVTVLTSSTVSEYKSEIAHGDLKLPFLRELKSDRYTGNCVSSYLETPNAVSGLPAQILTTCQVRGLRAVVYISYSEVGCLCEAETMKAFKPVLDSYTLRDTVRKSPSGDQEVVKLARALEQYNSLYI